ncbi:MAG TPA: hypothetical protein VGM10_24755 [Actinocrinis sp.]
MSTNDSGGFPQPQQQPWPGSQQPQQPVPGGAVPPFAQSPQPQYPQYPQPPGQSPQFGAFPQQPGPYQQPYGGYPSAQAGYGALPMARPPRPLSRILPILELVFAAAYILVGLGMILALNHRTSLANQFASGSLSPAAEAAAVGTARSADNLISTLSWVAIAVFLGALIVFAVWRQSLRDSLAPSGQFGPVLRQSGYVVFRVVWLASILLSFVATSTSSPDTLDGLVSLDNRLMLYYALRTAAGVVLLVLTLRLMQISQRVYRQQYFGPNVPVGF